MSISVPCAVGEVFDKVTILEIKEKKISDQQKLVNIRKELNLLKELIDKIGPKAEIIAAVNELRDVNEQLWEIEDKLRALEESKQFSDEFIQLARSVYLTNDRRSSIKKQINLLTGSLIVEEKSYSYL